MAGKQVRLFLVDGTSGGLTTAEITNWTGHIVTGARSDLPALIGREESKRTGVYILWAREDDATGGARAYIGEADSVGHRLQSHHRTKEFWERVAIITSKDSNLTKAHARYLESKLIGLARAASRANLENGTAPEPIRLPEADASDMDYFVSQLQILLPVVGIEFLKSRVAAASPPPEAPDQSSNVDSPIFYYKQAQYGFDASGQQVDGEFYVLAGSVGAGLARTSESYAAQTSKQYARFGALISKLAEEGAVTIQGSNARFNRDVPFSSPSLAASIVCGRSKNGRTAWKTADGQTFGQWESRGLAIEDEPDADEDDPIIWSPPTSTTQ